MNTLIKLKSEGLNEISLKSTSDFLKHIARYTDLNDPEQVKLFIASKKSVNYKYNLTKAYNHYVRLNGLSWERPRYNPKIGLPRPPTTEQVNKLVAGASKKYAPIFEFMAKTGASPMEVSIMTEENFEFENKRVFIKGRKGHLDRYVPLNDKTIALMKSYFVVYKRFPSAKAMGHQFRKYRNVTAKKLGDRALKRVRLYDLRHYFGTTLYAKTKDILYVKELMGHSKVETTLIYTKLVNFKSDEFTVRVANNLKECTRLLEAGFEYVTDYQDKKLFRKRK